MFEKEIQLEGKEKQRLMAIHNLERKDWGEFFQSQKGKHSLSIAVMHPAIGEQHEILSQPLKGIRFDEIVDEIQFIADGLTHRIQRPLSVAFFENDQDRSLSIAVRDQSNALHLIELTAFGP